MTKNDLRVLGFPKENYDKKWLDTLSDKELSETALADGETSIYESLKDFQDDLNSGCILGFKHYLWYFIA